jgi:hypothetical protein
MKGPMAQQDAQDTRGAVQEGEDEDDYLLLQRRKIWMFHAIGFISLM